jgi:hypothetical protein
MYQHLLHTIFDRIDSAPDLLDHAFVAAAVDKKEKKKGFVSLGDWEDFIKSGLLLTL